MDSITLKRIVESLVSHFGEAGARDYIGSGDYPLELKARAMSMIGENDVRFANAMVIESDVYDMESSWKSESTWKLHYAS